MQNSLFRDSWFLDDRKDLWGIKLFGSSILGPLTEARNFPEAFFVNGIYSVANLTRLPEIIEQSGFSVDRCPTFIHPFAYVFPRAQLGHGVFVYPGTYI